MRIMQSYVVSADSLDVKVIQAIIGHCWCGSAPDL